MILYISLIANSISFQVAQQIVVEAADRNLVLYHVFVFVFKVARDLHEYAGRQLTKWQAEMITTLEDAGCKDARRVAKKICDRVEKDLLMNSHVRPILGSEYLRNMRVREHLKPVMPSE